MSPFVFLNCYLSESVQERNKGLTIKKSKNYERSCCIANSAWMWLRTTHRSHLAWCSSENLTFSVESSILLWIAENSRLIATTALALLMSFGIMSIINNVQDILTLRHECILNTY